MDIQNTLRQLSELVKIQSVSTDPKRKEQMNSAVSYITSLLIPLGFVVKTLSRKDGHPCIIAEKKVNSAKKTIGIYTHYDVQPEDPVNEWFFDPFTMTQKDKKLYGRGIADNKMHTIQVIASLQSLISENKLNNNIIFVIEGEEENGSINFEDYMNESKELVKDVDVWYILDVGMYEKGIPQVFYGLRGLVYFELSLQIGERDLHSGIYGNRVLNPLQLLSELFSRIKNSQTHEITIPHLYDSVRDVPEDELVLLRKVERTDEDEQKSAGTYTVTRTGKYNSSLSSKLMPSLEIHGMYGGYLGDGTKTVIPKEAHAKFSIRLVEHQDSNRIEQLIRSFIQAHLPKGVKYILVTHGKGAKPFYTDIKNNDVQRTAQILSEHFGQETRFNRSGGSIPAAEIIQRLFGKPVIITGFTLPDENIHSPNENIDIDMFKEGIEALKKIFVS